MTSKAVEFHEEASLEYAAAFEWYFDRSEPVASRFSGELERAITQLPKHHDAGQPAFMGPEDSYSIDFPLQSSTANFPR